MNLNTSLKQSFVNSHVVAANKGKIKGHLPSGQIFGFCKTFKKITKELRFHISCKNAVPQDIVYTTLEDNIRVNFGKLILFVPLFIPDAETQIMFNDSIKNIFTSFFVSRNTNRKTIDIQLVFQIDIGTAQNISSPKYKTVALQTATRIEIPTKVNIIAFFDNLIVRKCHVDIDRVRFPMYSVSGEYASIDYVDRYRDLKMFYKECVAEELLHLFLKYTDMKTKNRTQVFDLRFQVDQINFKKIQLLKKIEVLLLLLGCL